MGKDSGKDVAELLRQGEAAAQDADWQRARHLFQAVLEVDPQNSQAFNNLGVVAFHGSEWPKAEAYWQKALSTSPPCEDALHNLTYLYHLQGKSHTPEFRLRPATSRNHESSPSRRSRHLESHDPGRRQLRVGFVTLWYERGQAYVSKALRDALEARFETFVLARNGSSDGSVLVQTQGEWDVPNLITTPHYQIDPVFFADWVRENRLQVVFFNEEQQFELVEAARQAGARTVGYYVWELYDPRWVPSCNRLYDALLTQTDACHDHFKRLGLNNLVRIPWGVSLDRFQPARRARLPGKVRFFHPAGWGGLYGRRGTDYVLEAFEHLQLPGAELIVHTQHGSGVERRGPIQILRGNLPREQLIRLYQSCDVAVLPSKWEGLGLTFLESLATGLPVVTVDAAPMNEFVRDGETGFLCRVQEWRSYPGIFVRGAHPDVGHMAECMARFGDRQLLERMSPSARRSAEERHDWARNGLKIVQLVADLVGEEATSRTGDAEGREDPVHFVIQ